MPKGVTVAFAGDAVPDGRGRSPDMLASATKDVCVHIRWMIRRDMPEVLDIENRSFEFAWTEEDFIRCLRQRNCIGMVAEHDERVVGFMIYELHKNRLHILNFAVHSDFRRCGVATGMIRKLVGKLSPQRRNRILLEIRETNLAAQLFFREAGFRAISVLREFYEDSPEDAYLMQYRYRPSDAELEIDDEQLTRRAG
jgi:ribosomal-protein-alanine N-acetyltransferase